MKVQEFTREHEIGTPEELALVLASRDKRGANSFWLSFSPKPGSTMLILVMKDRASLHFFPKGRHPGFTSIGHLKDLAPEGRRLFFMDGDRQEMNNDTVIPFENAVKAAKEFFSSRGQLPKCIEWYQLKAE
jgi:hypothetical protein